MQATEREEIVGDRAAPSPRTKVTLADARRWADRYGQRQSILKIAEAEGVDPGTVSAWLRKLGIAIVQGQHFVKQPPLGIPQELLNLLKGGPTPAKELIRGRLWGIVASQRGDEQLDKYCLYVRLHEEGLGVEKTAEKVGIHRSTALQWRRGTDMPYLAKAALAALRNPAEERWRITPLRVGSGGNELTRWIRVPDSIAGPTDIQRVLEQLGPTDQTYERARRFGIGMDRLGSMRLELFGYLLGFMLGDASKLGGRQERFASVNIDLQLSLKHESNESLGEFLCMCVNTLGLRMHRTSDKEPTGDSRYAQQPMGAYRWSSERSPLLAWAFSVGLGLEWGETTSLSPVRMDWILGMPRGFRLRFIQALADSDATVKPYEVVLTSIPNAEFTTEVLKSLGMKSAHTIHESGKPLRTMVSRREALTLPIFNEIVKGYRYEKLNRPFVR
jgi:transcriptional regulator with XRE-family HTH domain